MLFPHFFLASVSLFFFISDPILVFGSDARPPSEILIVADDLGYGDIRPYGGWIKTPHLGALAKADVQFMDFHSSASVCSPTRAGLLTGLYQQRCGHSLYLPLSYRALVTATEETIEIFFDFIKIPFHGPLVERARGTPPLSNTIVKIPEQHKWKRHAEALGKLRHVYTPVEQTLSTLCAS